MINLPDVENVIVRFDDEVIHNSSLFLLLTARSSLSITLYPDGADRRFPINIFRMDYDNKIGRFDFSYRLDFDGLEPIAVSNSLELTAEVEQCSSLPPFESWSIWDLE